MCIRDSVQGDVRIQQANGKIEAAQRGSKVTEGDTIITSPTGYAQLTMSDEAIIAVRPDTQIKIETYRFASKEDSNEKGVLGLLRGGFRTITGWIGRKNKDAYLVRTPTCLLYTSRRKNPDSTAMSLARYSQTTARMAADWMTISNSLPRSSLKSRISPARIR